MGPSLIEELPVKFATVATEVRTGHEIWLTHGRIVDAMRASYALPGIFAAVMVGDRWLVDGALVNPVPVSAARAFGAEIVIAANLSSDVFAHSTTIYSHGPTRPRRNAASENSFAPSAPSSASSSAAPDDPASPPSWWMPSTYAGPDHPRTAAGDPPDLLISPRVGQIGWFDFHRADDLIAPWRARGRARHRIHSGGDRHSGAALGGRRRAGRHRQERERIDQIRQS